MSSSRRGCVDQLSAGKAGSTVDQILAITRDQRVDCRGSNPWHFNTVPTQITPSHVTLRHLPGADVSSLPFDFVLLLIGYEADMSLLRCAGVKLNGDCQIPTYSQQTMETNVPDLYVAGCAVGGTQDKYALFLENCHVHVPRILAALKGEKIQVTAPQYARPES